MKNRPDLSFPGRLLAPMLITLLFAAPAHASIQEMKVTGAIKPDACQFSLPQGNTADYGTIPVTKLNDTRRSKLTPLKIQFNLQCVAPTRIALRILDNRPDDVIEAYKGIDMSYGIGRLGKKRIGVYYIRVEVKGNDTSGAPLTSLRTGHGRHAWDFGNIAGPQASNTWSTDGQRQPTPVTSVQGLFSIEPVIDNIDQRLTGKAQEVALDGSATVELEYL